jgi:hypothetical protein
MDRISAYREALEPLVRAALVQGERHIVVEALLDTLLALVPNEDPSRGMVELVRRGFGRQGIRITPHQNARL